MDVCMILTLPLINECIFFNSDIFLVSRKVSLPCLLFLLWFEKFPSNLQSYLKTQQFVFVIAVWFGFLSIHSTIWNMAYSNSQIFDECVMLKGKQSRPALFTTQSREKMWENNDWFVASMDLARVSVLTGSESQNSSTVPFESHKVLLLTSKFWGNCIQNIIPFRLLRLKLSSFSFPFYHLVRSWFWMCEIINSELWHGE